MKSYIYIYKKHSQIMQWQCLGEGFLILLFIYLFHAIKCLYLIHREREGEHSDAHILPIRIQSITSPKTKFKAKKSKEKLEGKKSY